MDECSVGGRDEGLAGRNSVRALHWGSRFALRPNPRHHVVIGFIMSFDQVPFGANADFADNPEPRCPCLLLLDTSGSMRGQPIDELNAGIRIFKDELSADPMAAKRVEIGIVGFGPVQILSDFQTVDAFNPPTLAPTGDTPMGVRLKPGSLCSTNVSRRIGRMESPFTGLGYS